MPAEHVIDVWQVPLAPQDERPGLRAILASYLDADPAGLAFVRGAHGKPALAGHDLQFSCSRSGGLALVAVSSGLPVGVDIECVQLRRPIERIARRWFAGAETEALLALRAGERTAGFHRCWTGKEAYVKGLGTGISEGLPSFSVAGLVGGRPRCSVDTWDVAQLPVPEGYAAAVAAPGSRWRARVRTLEGAGG